MQKILYLGTDETFAIDGYEVIHYPVITLIPRSFEEEKTQDCLKKLPVFTHVFFTSKNAVDIFFNLASEAIKILEKKCVSIGPATTAALQKRGITPLWEAALSSQEGIIEEMKKYSWDKAYIFYPRSSLARSVLSSYLEDSKIAYEALDLYDTVCQAKAPMPCLEEIDEIFFTSPSTVEGFFKIFPLIPLGKKIRFQGAVTEASFNSKTCK